MHASILLAFLATTALAAPTKHSTKHHHNNLSSFTVPSKAKFNVLTDVDTLRDMRNAFSKYNFDAKDFNSMLAGLDGITPAHAEHSKNKLDALNIPDIKNIPDAVQSIGAAIGSFLFGGYTQATKTAAPTMTPTKKYKPTTTTKAASSNYVSYFPSSSNVPVITPTRSEAAIISSTAPVTSDTPVSSVQTSTSVSTTTTLEVASTYVEPTSPAYSPPSSAAASPSYVSEPTTTTTAQYVTTTAPVVSVPPVTTSPVQTTLVTTLLPSFAFDPITSEAVSATQAGPATSTASKKAAATVNATPEDNQSEYLAPVTIGGQPFTLNFDTGSADLWVFSNQLSAAQIGGHAAFDSSKSPTWQPASGSSWKISYGDGSSASGNVGFDAVVIGGATATRQAVELATTVSTTFASDTNNDGLVGLAFSNINTITPAKQKTFFENIMADLEQPLFTADLRADASGTYEFGTIDPNKYTGDIHYTNIDASRGFWQFASTSYTVGGTTYQNAQAAPAIADTGTSICILDNTLVQTYYNQVAGAKFSSAAGGWIYPCTATLPDFGMAIGDSGFTAVLPGSKFTYAKLGDGTCFGGIQSNQGAIPYQILGDTMLKQYFAVFNGGAKKFGLAAKKA